ncbi:MAG: DUF1727 domain-containing protein [Dehalococcoidia bacterium]|nr:DUF1727 domain-containing protein [Dehalococcoidia bacterium]
MIGDGSGASGLAGSLRERGALLLARGAGAATRWLRRGGGTALPGLVATALAPALLEELGRLPGHGSVTVTGTNGKTTTAHLLSAAARAAGLQPLANHSGSNLERGIVSAFVAAMTAGGRLPVAFRRLGVFEVDEAALPGVLPRLRPRAALFLNLFRDQLDRYGEVDSLAEGWWGALEGDASGLTLVLNADDPSIARLAGAAGGEVVTFGVEDCDVALAGVEHAADARFCDCGALYAYDAVFIGHLGHWRCDACGRRRETPAVSARAVELLADGVRFELALPGETLAVALPLAGLHSVYNALAAAAGAHALGLPVTAIAHALEGAGPAFGRQERFRVYDRDVRLLLAKNPAGMNELLRTLVTPAPPGPVLHLLAVLNDGVADGRDVSWIYDADLELLQGRAATIVVSGTRADELALRLVLAGLEPALVEPHLASALERAIELTPPGARLDVLATYTAMVELREALANRTGVAPYWGAAS